MVKNAHKLMSDTEMYTILIFMAILFVIELCFIIIPLSCFLTNYLNFWIIFMLDIGMSFIFLLLNGYVSTSLVWRRPRTIR